MRVGAAISCFLVCLGTAAADGGCATIEKTLSVQRAMLCNSLVQSSTSFCGDEWKNATASKDWPSQSVYAHNILSTLVLNVSCLETSDYVRDTVRFMNVQGDVNLQGNFMNTWEVFQVQYYDMPRKPGTRIESPDTLGRKCWAFAYLKQLWNSSIGSIISKAHMNFSNFTVPYGRATALTMSLCRKVMANCFVNASYAPQVRNGTCPLKIEDFKVLGFQRENLKRGFIVEYPF